MGGNERLAGPKQLSSFWEEKNESVKRSDSPLLVISFLHEIKAAESNPQQEHECD